MILLQRLTAILWLGSLSCLLSACPAGNGSVEHRPTETSQPVITRNEILWDTWGVPHIYAKDNAALFRAFGWAQMQNHGNLILSLYGQARGRAAEYWGPAYLESDREVHTMGVPERAKEWYRQQRPAVRQYLDAFTRGVNDYAAAHPESLDASAGRVLPIKPEDVLAHMQRIIHLFFVAGDVVEQGKQWSGLGSNAWAVGRKRSASGNAMLIANPHLPWMDFFTWFEAEWNSPDTHAYGAALVGMPMLGIAFNEYLGWTHTNNTFDGADLYELTLQQGGYLYDGRVKNFETRQLSLKVRQDDGSLREEPLTIRASVHGPVISGKGQKALALRLTGLDQPHMLEQYWDMMHVRKLPEFEQVVARLQIPYFNIVYADRDGHVYYLFGGRTPRRPRGDWRYWQGIVPGNTSATLWTETLPYDSLPKVIDPMGNAVQNCNDSPWTCTLPPALDRKKYPPYLAPSEMGFRPKRSAMMLFRDDTISYQELYEYKHSTHSDLADRVIPGVIGPAYESGDAGIMQAISVLGQWDRNMDASSPGAVLFAEWVKEAGFLSGGDNGYSPTAFAEPGDETKPLSTPEGVADIKGALAALKRAGQRVLTKYGRLDVKWGDVYRLRFDGQDLPANGGPGELGVFRTVWYQPDKDGKYRAWHGDSYVALVEFGDTIRAQTLIPYGNASRKGHPHRGDQLKLFANKAMKTVWFSRREVEKHLEKREEM